MAVLGEHHPAFEEYCECIFELAEDDVDVIQARIADRLAVSRPAVSEMMRRMETEGLITTSKGIRLTEHGQMLGTQVVRRHRLAERFLTDVLDLSWAEAHHEAGKWEHVMSEAVEKAMNRLLGNPTTCPHGNPIPGSNYIEEGRLPPAAPTSRSARASRSVESPKSSSSRRVCSSSSRRARCNRDMRARSRRPRRTAR